MRTVVFTLIVIIGASLLICLSSFAAGLAFKVIAMMMRKASGTAGLVIAALFAQGAVPGVVRAQPVGEGDAERGRQAAERLCTSCHVTETSSSQTVPAGVPTMRTIANKPDQTAERIAGMLIDPHPPMPNVRLTRDEIDNIVAYLQSLRRPDLKPLRQDPGNRAPAKKSLSPASYRLP